MDIDQNPKMFSSTPLSTQSQPLTLKLRAREIAVDHQEQLLFILDDDRRIVHTFDRALRHMSSFTLDFNVESMTAAPSANLLFLISKVSGQPYIQVVEIFQGSLVSRWRFSSSFVSLACDLAGRLYTCEFMQSRIVAFQGDEPPFSFPLGPHPCSLTPMDVKLSPDKASLLVQNLEPAHFIQVYDLLGHLLRTFSSAAENFVRDAFTTKNIDFAIVCLTHQHGLHVLDRNGNVQEKIGGFGDDIGSFVRPFAIAFIPPDLFIICNKSSSYPIQCFNINNISRYRTSHAE